MTGVSSNGRPPILDTETERELLYHRLVDHVSAILPNALRPELTVGADADAITAMVLTGPLRNLRVLSARQLAVLLAAEANPGVGYEIHEPPRYGEAEIENVR
jgi:hypothetical protein